MSDVTRILNQIDSGDPRAAERLLPLVYDELRKLAAAKLAQEKPGQTLQATALVHEAYMRIAGNGQGDSGWNSKGHFFAAAAEAMRRILVERARQKRSLKHGGHRDRVEMNINLAVELPASCDLIGLDEVLEQLEVVDPKAAELVKLRFFAGLTGDQAAGVLGMSSRSADMLWAYARAWLYEKLKN
jgi:RNA polymerase sigma factor (TIGR02999 family)